MLIPGSERRALIWGARGFIGHHLVESLLASGWHVRVLTRSAAAPLPVWAGRVQWVELDPLDRATAFTTALDGLDVVFNLAGSSGAVASNRDPLESLESNCRLQLEFLSACARASRPPHVVFASSRLVYAPAGQRAVREDHPTAPRSIYAAHKLCVEHYHRIFADRGALTYTICRISNPYGLDDSAPGKGYGFINTLIQNALSGRYLTLFGEGRQLRDYIYVDDLTAALLRCADHADARNEIFNIGAGRSVSMRDAAEQILRALGGGGIDHRPWPSEYETVESGDFVADISKARARLGHSPSFTLPQGLEAIRRRCAERCAHPAPSPRTSPHVNPVL